MMNENEVVKMTMWRGGAIGLTSGLKGGALAGSVGGALLTGFVVAAGEGVAVTIYTTIVGLTLGLMAGAVVGAAAGVLLGWVSGRLWERISSTAVVALWILAIAALTAGLSTAVTGDLQLWPLVVGALCGAAGGWWGGRDFVWVGDEQESPKS